MTTTRIFDGGTRAIRASFVFFALGLVTVTVGSFVDRRQVFVSYLIAWTFVVSIAAGALIFLMICHTMRAGWPTAVRRIVEAIVSVFPVLAILFIPVCLGLDSLYPWLHPERFVDDQERAILLHKRPYLNAPFFAIRTVLFFAVWLAVAALLRRWSLRKDADPAADVDGKLYRVSAAALPAVALSMSFAAFDWLMSLTPLWYSTMFPVYFFAGGFLSAIALLSVSTYLAQRSGFLPEISRSHYYALGRLLLAFTIFWGYAGFFQFMLMWMADKPDEVSFYAARAHGRWGAVTLLLALGAFVVPFCLLLSYRIKQKGQNVAAIAAWLVAMHYLDIHWLVAPAARADRFPFHWLDLAALCTVGGLSVSTALLSLRGCHMMPIHDPRLPEALRYQSS